MAEDSSNLYQLKNTEQKIIEIELAEKYIKDVLVAISGLAIDADKIDAVYAELDNVILVANDIASVVTTATDITKVVTVANDIASVITVATNIVNVNKVGAIDSDVSIVAAVDTQITTLAAIHADITTVAGIATDVTGVALIASDVTAVNTEPLRQSILDAEGNATSAASDASSASDSAAAALVSENNAATSADAADVSAQSIDTENISATSVIANGAQTSGALSLPTTQVTGSIPILYTGNGTTQDAPAPMQIANDNGDGVTLAVDWVSTDPYIVDDVFIDNSTTGDARAYRCIVGHTGITTSPLLDTTNWVLELNQYGGRFWFKCRSNAEANRLFDSVRRENNNISSDQTAIEASTAGMLTSFNVNSVTIGATAGVNTNLSTYVLWVDQTTRKTAGYRTDAGVIQNSKNNTGTDLLVKDSAGNGIIEHYNPTTGFSIIMATGNGVAGRSMPHSLQNKPSYLVAKLLETTARNWYVYDKIGGAGKTMLLNSTTASTADVAVWNDTEPTDDNFTVGSDNSNTLDKQHIYYIQADSANHYIGAYHGTGAVQNAIDFDLDMTVAGSYVMIKRLDVANNWAIFDTLRGSTHPLFADLSSAEANNADYTIEFTSSGIVLGLNSAVTNALGGSYLIQAYSPKYAQPTGGSDVNVNASIDLTYTQGIGQTNLQETTLAHTISLGAFAGDKAYILKERGSDAIGFATGLPVAQERGDIVGYYLNTLDKKVYNSVDAATSLIALGECKVDGQGNAFDLVEYEPLESYFNGATFTGEVNLNANQRIVDFDIVWNNNRYSDDNPFGNENYEGCIVRAEIFLNGIWSEAQGVYDAGGKGIRGFSNIEGLVIQTGSLFLSYDSSLFLDGFGITTTAVTNAPCRVIVTKISEDVQDA